MEHTHNQQEPMTWAQWTHPSAVETNSIEKIREGLKPPSAFRQNQELESGGTRSDIEQKGVRLTGLQRWGVGLEARADTLHDQEELWAGNPQYPVEKVTDFFSADFMRPGYEVGSDFNDYLVSQYGVILNANPYMHPAQQMVAAQREALNPTSAVSREDLARRYLLKDNLKQEYVDLQRATEDVVGPSAEERNRQRYNRAVQNVALRGEPNEIGEDQQQPLDINGVPVEHNNWFGPPPGGDEDNRSEGGDTVNTAVETAVSSMNQSRRSNGSNSSGGSSGGGDGRGGGAVGERLDDWRSVGTASVTTAPAGSVAGTAATQVSQRTNQTNKSKRSRVTFALEDVLEDHIDGDGTQPDEKQSYHLSVYDPGSVTARKSIKKYLTVGQASSSRTPSVVSQHSRLYEPTLDREELGSVAGSISTMGTALNPEEYWGWDQDIMSVPATGSQQAQLALMRKPGEEHRNFEIQDRGEDDDTNVQSELASVYSRNSAPPSMEEAPQDGLGNSFLSKNTLALNNPKVKSNPDETSHQLVTYRNPGQSVSARVKGDSSKHQNAAERLESDRHERHEEKKKKNIAIKRKEMAARRHQQQLEAISLRKRRLTETEQDIQHDPSSMALVVSKPPSQRPGQRAGKKQRIFYGGNEEFVGGEITHHQSEDHSARQPRKNTSILPSAPKFLPQWDQILVAPYELDRGHTRSSYIPTNTTLLLSKENRVPGQAAEYLMRQTQFPGANVSSDSVELFHKRARDSVKEAEAYLHEQRMMAWQEQQRRHQHADVLRDDMKEAQKQHRQASSELIRQDWSMEMAAIEKEMQELKRGSRYNEKYLAEVDFQLESLGAYKSKEYNKVTMKREPRRRVELRSLELQQDVPDPIRDGKYYSKKGYQQAFGNDDIARQIAAFEQPHYV